MVDFVRSCFEGQWRFFRNRPDLLTPGYLYFAEDGTPAVRGLHPFGSNFWAKDRGLYPDPSLGHVVKAGTQWYSGDPPILLPPDNQIGDMNEFANALTFPPSPKVRLRGGFDERCWLRPAVEFDPVDFLIPDINDCCWQRVLARLLELLNDATPASITEFFEIANAIWGGEFEVRVRAMPWEVEGRYAVLLNPRHQIILLPGTQKFLELINELLQGLRPPIQFNMAFGTDRLWRAQATQLTTRLQEEGWSPDVPSTLAGHSKGAVLLAIMAVNARLPDPSRRFNLLTFGTPKPGNRNLVDFVELMNTRHVVNIEDLVPKLPPEIPRDRIIPIGARVFGGVRAPINWQPYPFYQIMLDGGRRTFEPLEHLRDEDFAGLLREFIRGEVPPGIANHLLSAYVARLKACCHEPPFPFSAEMWQRLFGEDNAIGGIMLGGEKRVLHSSPVGGAAVGGEGHVYHLQGGMSLSGTAGSGDALGGIVLGGTGGPGTSGGGVRIGGGDILPVVDGGVELGGGDVLPDTDGGVEIGG